MKIEIAVTREDIDKGVSASSDNCPVARAGIRAVKPYSRIKLTGASQEGLTFAYNPPVGYEGDCYYDAKIPKAVAKFMNKIDEVYESKSEEKAARAKLKPFAIVVKLPDAWVKNPEKASKKAKPAKKAKKKSKK